MTETDAIWASLILLGAAFEVWALRDKRPGNTLSEVTRRLFRVDTRTGKLVFLTLWTAFAVWFAVHIVS